VVGQFKSGPIERGTRTVDYYFLNQPEVNYVSIARKYREILLKHHKPSQSVDSRYRLRLLMGTHEEYQDSREFLRATSFRQAEEILKDLHRMGIRDLQVVLVGWTQGGLLGDNPRFFPADSHLGGMKGLQRLIATGRKMGYSIGLEFDNSYTFKKSKGFRRNDTVKDIQNVPIDIGKGNKEYLLCQKVAWHQFRQEQLRQLEALQVKGMLYFDGINDGLFTCFDPRHSCGSQEMARSLQRNLVGIGRKNRVGATVLTDYLFVDLSGVVNLSPRCSSRSDRPVPLTPLIFHGVVPYSFEPLNLRRDSRREFLQMIEYGAVPVAYLTSEPRLF
jgi:hypothetical protein